jgi:hypothetical protein
MTNLGVHILPLAFPCTLAMIRKVATMIGPGSRRSLIRMAGLVYESGERQRAASIKQQAATFCRATILIIDLSNKQQATCGNVYNLKKF